MIRHKFTRLLALLLFAVSPAVAGPTEDGDAAYEKGDFKTAAGHYEIAAAQGDTWAQGRLGFMLSQGSGVARNMPQAVQWLTKAADKNEAFAQVALGELFAQGTGVEQDMRKAVALYQKAADQGFSPGLTMMGELYLSGYPGLVRQNYVTAATLLKRAAEMGEPQAAFRLGFMNYSGTGVPVNYINAGGWFLMSAAKNYTLAQAMLGVMYANGQGVPQDFALSIKYLRLAALRGSGDSLGMLGQDYLVGRGVTLDLVRGYMLVNLAASQLTGANAAAAIQERDTAARQLSQAQLQAAQKLGFYCAEKGFTLCLDDSIPVMTAAANPAAAAGGQGAPAAKSDTPQLAGNGTGFFVSANGYMVTAAHVTAGCADIRATGLKLKVVAQDAESDVAILASGQRSPAFIKLRGGRGPRVGEQVVAIGFPLQDMLGHDVIVTTGIVSSLAGLGNDRRTIQISAPIQPGNSGGPVVGEDGALVGVAVSSIGTVEAVKYTGGALPQNVNFAASVGTLQSFLNAHQVPYVQSGLNDARKNSAEIASLGQRYTVMLECWK